MGSELSCTPGKRGGGRWNGGEGGESERERESSLPLSPSSRPSFFFSAWIFFPALYYLDAWNRLLYLRPGWSQISKISIKVIFMWCHYFREAFPLFVFWKQSFVCWIIWQRWGWAKLSTVQFNPPISNHVTTELHWRLHVQPMQQNHSYLA